MRITVHLNDETPKKVADCLREIAEKMENEQLSGRGNKSDCKYYFTARGDTVDNRKFIVYSNEGYTLNPDTGESNYPMESNNSQILGITFGSCMNKTFYKFLESETGQNHVSRGFRSFIIRETVGEPKYVNIK